MRSLRRIACYRILIDWRSVDYENFLFGCCDCPVCRPAQVVGALLPSQGLGLVDSRRGPVFRIVFPPGQGQFLGQFAVVLG